MVQTQKLFVYVFYACFLLSNLPTYSWGRRLFEKEGPNYAVKTIKTEYGDIYDCIDFYKQPAFNHALLKNHTFHPSTRSNSKPKMAGKNTNSLTKNDMFLDMIRFKGESCPSGTVPIRRVNKYDPDSRFPEHNVSGTVFALGQTKNDPSKKYYGANGVLSAWNPQVKPNQYTSAEIILRGGTDSIIAGWTVNPAKYGDTQTRFFIYANANNKLCFDSECGFVVTRPDTPLNFILSPLSNITGPIYTYPVFVYQDAKDGNYYLQVSSRNIELGFWPQNIFAGMKNGASYAGCGGEVYSQDTVKPIDAPVMGAGTYPDIYPDKKNFAFCKFSVVDDSHNVVVPTDIEKFTNNPEYNAVVTNQDHGKVIYYGGPFPVNV
ncbi:uncharacterized protein [Spinacia oleracea]|uniref:Neprosin PEP catalytic domain-containing protein n=1 Tax=Spinacia oleracea TaxID=3562 RepID=A0ABM3R2P5_SPIOL|nr:uncharacterized protein LOC110787545 [Spinacia oleracea]